MYLIGGFFVLFEFVVFEVFFGDGVIGCFVLIVIGVLI